MVDGCLHKTFYKSITRSAQVLTFVHSGSEAVRTCRTLATSDFDAPRHLLSQLDDDLAFGAAALHISQCLVA